MDYWVSREDVGPKQARCRPIPEARCLGPGTCGEHTSKNYGILGKFQIFHCFFYINFLHFFFVIESWIFSEISRKLWENKIPYFWNSEIAEKGMPERLPRLWPGLAGARDATPGPDLRGRVHVDHDNA